MFERYRITEESARWPGEQKPIMAYQVHRRRWGLCGCNWEYVSSGSTFAAALSIIQSDKYERQLAKIKPRRFYVK